MPMNMVATGPRTNDLSDRIAEIEALSSAFEASARGEGAIALITGEPGIGKTALLRAFLRDARRLVPLVALTECLQVEATQPFAPMPSLLRAFASLAPDLTEKLRSSFKGGQSEGDALRAQTLMNWIHLVEGAAEQDPLIIAIDDLHWADEATLALVAYTAKKIAQMRVLLVCTSRDDEVTATAPFEQTRSELRRRPGATHVALRPLTIEGTSSFVRRFFSLSNGPDRDFVARLHARTDGNPLLMEELLRTVAERRLIAIEGQAWRGSDPRWDEVVPATINSSVAARLRALSPAVAADVTAAAVLGSRFVFRDLAQLTRRTERELLSSLRAAIEAQLVEEGGRGKQFEYRFRHALIRDAVEGTVLGPERSALHAAAAVVLEGHAGPAHLAYHLDASGQAERAAEHHLFAAVEADYAAAFDAALRHSERALELTARPLLPDEVMRILPMWHHHANPARALRFADRLLELYADGAHALYRGRVLTFRGLALDLLDRPDDARASCAAAIEVLRPLGDSGHLARALSNYSFFTANDQEAMALAEDALVVARRSADVGAFIHTATSLGGRLMRAGRFDEGIKVLDEAERVIRRPSIPSSAQLISLAVLNSHLRGAPGTRVRRQAIRDEIISLGHAAELRSRPVVVSEYAAALARGDWDACIRLSDELREFTGARRANADDLRTVLMHVFRDGPSTAASLLAVEVPRDQPKTSDALFAAGWSAAIALAVGQFDRALRFAAPVLEAAIGPIGSIREPLAIVPGVIFGLSAASATREPEAVLAWTEAILSTTPRTLPAVAAIRSFAEFERSRRLGDLRSGLTHLRACIDRLDDLDEPIVARQVRLELVKALAESGETTEAQRELDPLIEYWRVARADWYLDQLREQSHGWGLVFPATRGPQHTRLGTALTRREREVAALIAEGLTNKDIAARLEVSPRTAESHVERIRGKLGFSSRAQIAAWVSQQTRVS